MKGLAKLLLGVALQIAPVRPSPDAGLAAFQKRGWEDIPVIWKRFTSQQKTLFDEYVGCQDITDCDECLKTKYCQYCYGGTIFRAALDRDFIHLDLLKNLTKMQKLTGNLCGMKKEACEDLTYWFKGLDQWMRDDIRLTYGWEEPMTDRCPGTKAAEAKWPWWTMMVSIAAAHYTVATH